MTSKEKEGIGILGFLFVLIFVLAINFCSFEESDKIKEVEEFTRQANEKYFNLN